MEIKAFREGRSKFRAERLGKKLDAEAVMLKDKSKKIATHARTKVKSVISYARTKVRSRV